MQDATLFTKSGDNDLILGIPFDFPSVRGNTCAYHRLSRRTCLCFMQVCAGLLILLVLPLRSADSKTVYLNTAPGVAYVGSQVCSGCYQIYRRYVQTDMGSPVILATSRPSSR